jgi:hypothetical protein
MWSKFIAGFCKAEFLCYAGSPHWLGWGILIFGFLAIIFTFLMWYGK